MHQSLQSIEDHYHAIGITHTRIALCHAQVAALIEAMTKNVLPIDLEDMLEAQEMLEEMARERVEQLNGDHPDVKRYGRLRIPTREPLHQNGVKPPPCRCSNCRNQLKRNLQSGCTQLSAAA